MGRIGKFLFPALVAAALAAGAGSAALAQAQAGAGIIPAINRSLQQAQQLPRLGGQDLPPPKLTSPLQPPPHYELQLPPGECRKKDRWGNTVIVPCSGAATPAAPPATPAPRAAPAVR